MSTTDMVNTYGEAWNEPDPGKRQALLDKAWADDGVYCDPTATVEGRAALLAHIEGFRSQFAGARIETRTGVDEHGTNFRFGWAMVDESGTTMMEGVDFGRTGDDGRIVAITGFFGPLT